MLPTLLLAACAPSDPGSSKAADTAIPTTSEPVAPVDSAIPGAIGDTGGSPGLTSGCTGVEAVLFDLGETLVTLQGDVFHPIPGAYDLLDALVLRGVRIGVVTNTAPGWDLDDLRDLLAEPEVLDRFEVVLLSSQAASPPKPAPEIFAEAHAMLVGGPPIGQTAFVTEEIDDLADREASPTEGARAAGMFGVWVGDPPSALADATVPDLAAISAADWLCP